ncbi:MAG TPA: ferric reductase-like transmembrane domain-containing protein [Polyangiaceae bacterium]|nr:ferric reductase-like transmembrane domain-containing protein [Polyangiaceae bacterium]
MQTTDAGTRADAGPRPASPRVDTGFAKRLVAVNVAVPVVLLAWDATQGQLGADGVKFAIHTTGMVGLVLLGLSLAVTPLRMLSGWTWLIALRRTLGLSAFFYLCAHFAIFFAFDREASVDDTLHEILLRRYLQIGTAALLLLVPLAVTSTDSMITRLGPRRWKAIHRLVYLAAGLGVLHYYMQVKADVRQPLVFAAILTGLLAFRPAQLYLDARRKRQHRGASGVATRRRFWSGELRVLGVVDETPDVRTFRLGLAGGGPLPFVHEPGQYLNLALTIDGQRVNRSYTIASPPGQRDHCEITVKRLPTGRASRHLHEALRQGATVKVSAPAGRFVFTGAEADGVVLIAGGVGITPLMAMIRYLTDHAWAAPIHLVYGVRKQADIIFAGELESLARRFPNLHVVVTLSGGDDSAWAGARGRISAGLLRAVPGIATLPAYLCGPDAMMAEVRLLLAGLGVPADRIQTEAFVSAATAGDMPGIAGAAPVPADLPVIGEAASVANEGTPMVYFRRSKRSAEFPSDRTLLEVAEDVGLDIPFECRSGICGQCKTRLLEGRVTMDVQDALSAADKAKGIILACQAHAHAPGTDVAVDA